MIVKNFERFSKLKGKNITMDRLYGDLLLAEELFDKNDVSVIMIMKKGRKGLPAELQTTNGREEFSKNIHYRKDKKDIVLLTYTTKTKSKGLINVIAVTTMRPVLGQTKDAKAKPALLKMYDFTKIGTDIVDQKMVKHDCTFQTNSWSKVLFAFMLNTTRVNAKTLWAIA